MVIAVRTFALAPHPDQRRVGAGLGSVAPTPRRAPKAETFLAEEPADTGRWTAPTPLPDSVVTRFGELVAAATDLLDDVRGSATYRRHAIGVLARRTVSWAWHDYFSGRQQCA